MRILHILNHTRRLNGHVHAAVDLACAQRALGHDVCVASEGGDFDALLEANEVERAIVGHRRRPWDLAKSLASLISLLRRWRPDIVHAHMMTSAALAWPACRLAGIPLITTVHNAFERSAVLMGLGNRVIAVSDAVGTSMNRRGVPRSRMRVVLNGTIGSARFRHRDATPRPLGAPSILFVGGQHPRKGVPDLLRAFDLVHADHPQASLHIVGDGPHLSEYRGMAEAMSCAKAVFFAGGQSDPYPWMLGADIFVLPSHADPAPLVLPEAREAGCAVIGTEVDGIPQLLAYGRAGIVVPPRDPAALADALRRLLGDPRELAFWKEASQIEIDSLTIRRVALETLDVYADVVRRPGRNVAVAR